MTTQRTMPHGLARQPVSAAAPADLRTPKGVRRAGRSRRAAPRPTPHLTMGQYARLLAAVDAAGVATIDAISRALPDVSQPVSAVFDLCDRGILNVDWEAAFDGDVHVWRIDF